MQSRGQAESDSGHTGNEKWDKWSRQWQDWERWARDTRNQAADVGHKVASTLEMAEAKLRREADRLRPGAAGSGDAAASQSRGNSAGTSTASGPDQRAAQLDKDAERKAYERARRRASREAGFYVHLMWYGIVIGSLPDPEPHRQPVVRMVGLPRARMGHRARQPFRRRCTDGAGFTSAFSSPPSQREVQREVTREKEVLRTEKQASLDELTASFAHEIRNPIAAAKSLVQQMGEDPTSNENVEYAKVALDELARVERSVSHLLKYAKETTTVSKTWGWRRCSTARSPRCAPSSKRTRSACRATISEGPTVRADADKLRQVFTNVIDNAIDAMESNAGERRLEFGI